MWSNDFARSQGALALAHRLESFVWLPPDQVCKIDQAPTLVALCWRGAVPLHAVRVRRPVLPPMAG